MAKEKTVDYSRAMQDYEKSMGRKVTDDVIPIENKITPDGGVDYIAVSRDYEKYLIESKFIIPGKK